MEGIEQIKKVVDELLKDSVERDFAIRRLEKIGKGQERGIEFEERVRVTVKAMMKDYRWSKEMSGMGMTGEALREIEKSEEKCWWECNYIKVAEDNLYGHSGQCSEYGVVAALRESYRLTRRLLIAQTKYNRSVRKWGIDECEAIKKKREVIRDAVEGYLEMTGDLD